MAHMCQRILAGLTGPGMFRAYIESNLALRRENRKDRIAVPTGRDLSRGSEHYPAAKGVWSRQ